MESPAVPRIHEPREDPFGLLAPVGRKRQVLVLHARILAERALEGEQRAEAGQQKQAQDGAARDQCVMA